MMTNVFHAFGTAMMTSTPIGNTVGTLLPAALLISVVVMVVGGLRWRALVADHTTQTQQLQQQNDLLRALQEQVQKLRTDLDERQREVQSLRQESGAQRKKNHVTQDEIKRLRASLKEETERRVAAQNTRPAFAEPAAPKLIAAPTKPIEAKQARATEAKQEPKQEAAASQAPSAPEPRPAELALQAQVKSLETQLAHQKQTLGDERVLMSGLKDELKKLRKRSEDLRRIDIITKSKMEVIEDKMRHLGRAHYEAISEIALLKGEVRPPRPRERPRQVSMFEAPDLAETTTAATDENNENDNEFTAASHHDAPSVAQRASLL